MDHDFHLARAVYGSWIVLNDLCHLNESSLHRFPDAQPQGGAGGGAPPSGGDQLGDDGEDDLYS